MIDEVLIGEDENSLINVTSYRLNWTNEEDWGESIALLEIKFSKNIDKVITLKDGLYIQIRRGFSDVSEEYIFEGTIVNLETVTQKYKATCFSLLQEGIKGRVKKVWDRAIDIEQGVGSEIFKTLCTLSNVPFLNSNIPSTGTEENLRLQKFIADGEDPYQKMQRLAEYYNRIVGYIPGQGATFLPKSFVEYEKTLTVGQQINGELVWDDDALQLCNKVIVNGATVYDKITQTFAATGTQFNLSRTPEDTEVRQDNETGALFVRGQKDTPGDWDYYVDVENQRLIFKEEQSNIWIRYGAQVPIPRIWSNFTSIDEHGGPQKTPHIKEFTFPEMKDVADVDKWAQEYLAKYSIPFVNTQAPINDRALQEAGFIKPGYLVNIVDTRNNKNVNVLVTKIRRTFPHTNDIITVGDKVWRLEDWDADIEKKIDKLTRELSKNQDIIVEALQFEGQIRFGRRYKEVKQTTLLEGAVWDHPLLGWWDEHPFGNEDKVSQYNFLEYDADEKETPDAFGNNDAEYRIVALQYYTMRGDLEDQSESEQDGTYVSGTFTNDRFGENNSALSFDVTADPAEFSTFPNRITTPEQNYTFYSWVRFRSFVGGTAFEANTFAQQRSGGNNWTLCCFEGSQGYVLRLWCWVDGDGSTAYNVTSGSVHVISLNEPHLLGFSVSGNVWSIWLDGVKVGENTLPAGISDRGSGGQLGAASAWNDGSNINRRADCIVDEFGSVDKVLTQSQWERLYEIGLTRKLDRPLRESVPLRLTRTAKYYSSFSGNADDESQNNNNATINNVTLVEDINGNPNSAYLFNGVDSEVAQGSSGLSATESKVIAIGFKLNSDGVNTPTSQPLITTDYFYMHVRNTNNNLTARYDAANAHLTSVALGEGDRDWHYAIGTYEKIATDQHRLRIYLDGALVSEDIRVPDPTSDYAGSLKIGRRSTETFDGILDEPLIRSGTITLEEVQALTDKFFQNKLNKPTEDDEVFEFDGIVGRLRLGTDTLPLGATSSTQIIDVEMIENDSTSRIGGRLYGSPSGSRSGSFHPITDGQRRWRYYIRNTANQDFFVESTTVWELGQRNIVAGVLDVENSQVRIYINGVMEGSIPFTGTPITSTNPPEYGWSLDSAERQRGFRFRKPLTIVARAMTDLEIKAYANGTLPPEMVWDPDVEEDGTIFLAQGNNMYDERLYDDRFFDQNQSLDVFWDIDNRKIVFGSSGVLYTQPLSINATYSSVLLNIDLSRFEYPGALTFEITPNINAETVVWQNLPLNTLTTFSSTPTNVVLRVTNVSGSGSSAVSNLQHLNQGVFRLNFS